MDPITRFKELSEDWHFFIQRDGVKSALPVICKEVIELPYRHLRYIIFSRSLIDPLPEIETKPTFEILPFRQDHLPFIRSINRPSEFNLCSHRLARGHYGFVALLNHKLVGYAWASNEVDKQVERVPLELKPGEILCNDAFTTPSYRGRGIQTFLTLARLHMLKELGYQKAVCYIERHNNPSIAVWQRKLNSTITGYIDFQRIGPWYHIRFLNN